MPSRRLHPFVAPLLGLCLLLGGCAEPETPFLRGGIQVNEPDHARWIAALQEEGLNAVAVTDYAKQGDWDSANLWWDDERAGVLSEIRAAEGEGLLTVLVLRVALDHAFERNRFLWHGMIRPETEEDLAEWFRRYTRFVLEWARVAETEGVDLLFVGSELSSLTSTLPVSGLPPLEEFYLNTEKQAERRAGWLEHQDSVETRHLWVRGGEEGYGSLAAYLDDRIGTERAWAERSAGIPPGSEPRASVGDLHAINVRRALLERHWEELIGRVREVYDGPLGYAANFDQYHDVGFWDRLDVMGINAYFPLRGRPATDGPAAAAEAPETLLAELTSGWTRVLDDIARFRAKQGLGGMPVVFTEIGYTPRSGSTVQPWAGEGLALVGNGEEGNELVAWQDRPAAPTERSLAIEALAAAHRAREEPFLQGLLYWKLSSLPEHREIEPFVAILDADPPDPLVEVLREVRFTPDPGGGGDAERR